MPPTRTAGTLMTTSARIIAPLLLFTSLIQHSPSHAAQARGRITTRSPNPVTLTLRLPDGRRRFRPGEIIPIELEFNSSVSKRFVVDGATYDRSGRLTIDELRIEPADAVTDPMLDYFASSAGSIGGGLRSMGVLGEKPYTVKLDLNDWFRFDEPGTYNLSLRSRRVADEAQTAATPQSVVPVESNSVSFEVLPRDHAWEASELGAALQILDSKTSAVDRRTGCRMLRFLATDAAVDEMIKRYDDGKWDCDFEYMTGLFGAPNRSRVVRQLEAGLRASSQPVTQSYLRTLALLSVYVQHPELRAAQTRETKGQHISGGELSRHPDLMHATEAGYAHLLTAALPGKTGLARAITLAGLFESSQRRDSRSSSEPAASPGDFRGQLTATFLDLPVDRQVSLLQYHWRDLANAEMLPILGKLAEGRDVTSGSVADLALRRLYELAPEKGRALILRDIRSPRRGQSLATLGILPDRELLELDDVLAAGIDPSQDLDALSIRTQLLHRYASPAVSARVLSQVDDALTRMACTPLSALLAYFARADADLGKALLNRVVGSRKTTGCYASALRDVAALRMTPAVEAVAVAHLAGPDPQVVMSAVETLGRYGSGASQAPLRKQFERWHHVWEGRKEELQFSHAQERQDAAQGMVESAFLQALGQGQAWLTGKRDLGELRDLCVTDNCRTQARTLIDAADDTRITILRVETPGNSLVTLAQYQLTSISALEQKLAQYPKGTSFTLDVSPLDPQSAPAIVSEVMRFADARGITVHR